MSAEGLEKTYIDYLIIYRKCDLFMKMLNFNDRLEI